MAFLDNTGLSYLWGKIKAYVSSAISGKEDSSNKVDSVDSTSTDDEYPSAKAVYDWISAEKGAINGIAELDSNGLIPSDQLPPMTILSYGNSTWAEFLAAYQAHNIVYCRASSNSNPASGSQTRLAFMAYVDNATTPTNVEFQYYRSVSTHSDSQQGDQVYVYKLTNANNWTVTVRSTFTKVAAGTGLSGTWNNGVYTTKANLVSETNLTNAAVAATEVAGRVYPVAADANGKLAVNVPWESGGGGADPSSTTPNMDGTASVGTENAYARGDHVHPSDTSREATSNKVTSLSSSSSDTEYPSAKAVYDFATGDGKRGLIEHVGKAFGDLNEQGYYASKIIHIENSNRSSETPIVFQMSVDMYSFANLVLKFDVASSSPYDLSIDELYCYGESLPSYYAKCSSNTCDIYMISFGSNAVSYTISDVYTDYTGMAGITITYPNESTQYNGSYLKNTLGCTEATKIELRKIILTNNLVTSLSSSSTNSQAPSAKAVYDKCVQKVGDTMSGDLTISRDDASSKFVVQQTKSGYEHQMQFTSATSGNAGVFDDTNNKWIFYSTSAGELHYTQGYVDNNGLVWWRVRNTNTTNPHEIDLGVNATGQAGIYDRTFEKYLIVSDKSGAVTLTTINNKINTSSANEIGFTAKNTTANKQVDLVVTSEGYAGLYDRTNSKWMMYSNASGALVVPQNLYHYGVNYEYFSGLTKGTNPTSTTETGLYISDKNGNAVAKRLANFKCEVNTSGTTSAQMRAYRFVADSTYWADLMVQIPTSSNPSVYVSGTQVNYQLAHMGGPNWSNTSLAHGMRVYKWGRMVMLTLENCKMTAAVSANTTILTLDAAYKPIYQVGFMSTSSKRFYIGTSGNVYCASALAKDETPRCSITYISAS